MNTKRFYISTLISLCLVAVAMFSLTSYAQQEDLPASTPASAKAVSVADAPPKRKKRKLPKAASVDLKKVVEAAAPGGDDTAQPPAVPERELAPTEDKVAGKLAASKEDQAAIQDQAAIDEQAAFEEQAAIDEQTAIEAQAALDELETVNEQDTVELTAPDDVILSEDDALAVNSKFILGMEVPPNTSARLTWTPESKVSGLAERTPVLVVNGKNPGKTLCLTGAVHGDELNGIEMIRRIMYQLEPEKLTGTVIGVPVVNLMGFRRNSRYLPDRRDLNRFFPGNTRGSSASRIAHSFFTKIIRHCDALVDIHTGSLHRTNLTQLRADLSNPEVASLAQSFGSIAVLNSRGNPRSLRAAAVRAGIPTITVEAGEPMRMQRDVVAEGTKAIETLMAKLSMYGRSPRGSSKYAPVYYKSSWVRANQSGIFFSNAPLGQRVVEGEVLGTVTDPITNKRSEIISPYRGRILGMALDQVVLPGFAIYHIGIQTAEAILIEEGLLGDEGPDDEAGVQAAESSANGVDAQVPLQDSLDEDE